MATKIMIIRHGEKPDGNIHGVTENGDRDPDELSVRGWQRAGALVRFFAPVNGALPHESIAKPDALFAPSDNGGKRSVRSSHLLKPLSDDLDKRVDVSCERDNAARLAKALQTVAGVALIAWEHDCIPDIVEAITGDRTLCPQKWPDPRFDLVWVLDRKGNGWTFTQVPQMVLPGDKADVIPMVKIGKP